MLKGSLNRDFSLFSDAEFETRGLHITNSMTGNPLFAGLQDRLPEIKAAQEKYSANLASARALGKQPVAEKNKSRLALSFLLGNLALLVMAQTTDVAELLTTGFVLRKQPEPRQITSPGNVTLSAGLNPGEINLYVDRPKGAESFLHQISDTSGKEERVWVSTATTSNKHVFSNLQPGKLYAVRSAAVGRKGQIAYSTIGTIYAQ